MKDYRTLLLTLVIVGLLLPVAASLAQEEPPVMAANDEYAFVVGDQIQILVQGQVGYDQSYVVPVEGEVAYPHLGKITLLGKTKKEIEEEIARKLKDKGELTDPKVFVIITAYAPRFAYLWGAATGAIPLEPHKKHTLLQVLSTARIQPAIADFRNIKVIRTSKTGKKFDIPVNLNDVVTKNRFDLDIHVMTDDIIVVPSFEDKTQTGNVYILGKVNKPGKYGYIPGREKMTLTHLVALAGDFHQFADESRIRILRQQRSGTELIKLDFDDIIDLSIEDPPLEPDDLVYVPESFF
jgi:polysaccharide export outer membrane protein